MRRQKLPRLRSGDMDLGKEEVVGIDHERSVHEKDAAWPAIALALAELRGVIERCLGNLSIQFPVQSDHLDLYLRSCSMSVDLTPSISNLLFSLSSHSAASWLPSLSIPQRLTLQQDLVLVCAELNSGQRMLEIGPIAILLAMLFNKQACSDDYDDDDEIWESIYDVCPSQNTPAALPSPPLTPLLSIVAPTLRYSLPPPPVYFYRVFDNLTHCGFTFLHGFVCGDPVWPSIPRPFHFDASLLLSHLDWRSRVPSRYISVYNCPQRASWEAGHRLALGHRQNIWVATIDAGALFASGASCMSTAQAMETLGITEKHSKYLKMDEWFVFGQIPRVAVVQLDAAVVFSFKYTQQQQILSAHRLQSALTDS